MLMLLKHFRSSSEPQTNVADFAQSSGTRGSSGSEGTNSPAKARRCRSSREAPAFARGTIFAGSTGTPIGLRANSGDDRIHSDDSRQSPKLSYCSSTLFPSGST